MAMVNLDLIYEHRRTKHDLDSPEATMGYLSRFSPEDCATMFYMMITDIANKKSIDAHRTIVSLLADWMACEVKSLPRMD